MKNIIALTALLCGFCLVAHAKISPQKEWFTGVILLTDHTVVKGEVSYDFKNDLVMSRTEGKIQTYSPRQVRSFRYYDPSTNIIHRFTSLDHSPKPRMKQTSFFEIVLQGDIFYLRKHNRFASIERNDNHMPYQTNIHRVCYDYYVYYDNQLIKAKKFSSKVLPSLKQDYQSVADYIKDENLKLYDVADQILLIQHLNAKDSPAVATSSYVQ